MEYRKKSVGQSNSTVLLLITALTILSTYFLIKNLNSTGLWVDEGWSVAATNDDLSHVINMAAADVHPPLFFAELMVWRQFIGDTIFALRYFTLLINLLGIAIIFQLGSSLFNTRTGLIAALIFTTHDLVVVLGAEIRQYPQLYVLCGLTLWLYWRLWHRPTRQRTILFILSGIALIWTHYWGGFILLALGIHTLLTRLNAIKQFLVAYIAIGLSFVPWLYTVYVQLTEDVPDGLGHAIPNGADGYRILAFQLLGLPELFWIVLLIFGMIRTLDWSRHRAWLPTPATSLPAIVLILTLGLSIAINVEYPSLSFRALSVVIPAITVLAAHTVAQFRIFEQIVLVAFIVVQSLATTSAAPPTRLPWQDVANYLAAHSNAGDAVLIETWFDTYALTYYLEQTDASITIIQSDLERRAKNEQDFQELLDNITADYDGLWVVRFASDENISSELVTHGIVNTASRLWETPLSGDIDLWRFDHPPRDRSPIIFGDILRLEQANAEVLPNGDVVVNLLWSPTRDPDQNYTVSTFLLDQNGILVGENNDSHPFDNLSPTSGWQQDQLYFDSHLLATEGIPPGSYSVGVKLYYFVDPAAQQLEIVPIANCEQSCEYTVIDSIDYD